MGLAMKLINNMLGQIQTVAIAEAMVLGRKAGLDAKKIYEVVSASTGNSVQFQNRVPRILARNFTPGGTLDISFKDQELESAFAKRLGVPLFLANVSQHGLPDGARRRIQQGRRLVARQGVRAACGGEGQRRRWRLRSIDRFAGPAIQSQS